MWWWWRREEVSVRHTHTHTHTHTQLRKRLWLKIAQFVVQQVHIPLETPFDLILVTYMSIHIVVVAYMSIHTTLPYTPMWEMGQGADGVRVCVRRATSRQQWPSSPTPSAHARSRLKTSSPSSLTSPSWTISKRCAVLKGIARVWFAGGGVGGEGAYGRYASLECCALCGGDGGGGEGGDVLNSAVL